MTSRYDQLIRQWDWADELWAVVHESVSEEDFAARLAAFSAKVSATVAADRKIPEAVVSPPEMNGTALPHFIPAEAPASLPPDCGVSEA